MENNKYPFVNLPLPYDYDALEPFIDEKTMCLHHDRHLQTYIDNLNKVLEKYPSLQGLPLERLICGNFSISSADKTAIRNNAGGVYNHRFFFSCLSPEQTEPCSALLDAVKRQYGSFENFCNEFKASALSVFGSGYAWLVKCRNNLKIVKTANQDTPLCSGMQPILNLDVWEHAYYLKHYNLRADYIDDWFNVINWDFANRNYNKRM